MIDNQRHHLSGVVPKWKSGKSVLLSDDAAI